MVLSVVTTPAQILANIATFHAEVPTQTDLSWKLFRQTTYWVYDPGTGCFGPSKYVGFDNMDGASYQQAKAAIQPGDKFDGHITRNAIEDVVGVKFRPDPKLEALLASWATKVFGVWACDGITTSKWKFVTI
jgi:hypothetical protein